MKKKLLFLLALPLLISACGPLSSNVSSSSSESVSSSEGPVTSSSLPSSEISVSSSAESISSTSEVISSSTISETSSKTPSEGISVTEAINIAKGLKEGAKSVTSYQIYGYVSNDFDPKESSQQKGTYNFDVVDTQGGEYLISWWLSGSRLPVKGEAITLNCKLQHYVDAKTSVHKYEGVDGSFTVGGSSSSSSEPISSSKEPVSSSSLPSSIISVSEAVDIAKSLGEGKTSSSSYTIAGFVSNGFDPKESTQTKGTYNFDVVDSQGSSVKLIAWYLAGSRIPNKGEAVTLEAKLQHYVDKSSNHKYEAVDGTFTLSGSSSSSSEPISSSSDPSTSGTSFVPPSPIDDDPNWVGLNFNTYGATFRNKLATLIKDKVTTTTTYSNCLSIGAKAAAYPNKNSSTFVPFYHSTDTTTTTNGCNREHVWPASRGGDQFETDPFMIRPTISGDNSSRGNGYFGYQNDSKNYWDPASLGYEGSRGEAARIILYGATKYYTLVEGLDNRAPVNGESAKTAKKAMGKLSTLLEWNAKYPVSAIEKQINEYLFDHGYGRNPFVDHPEYANWIWDNNGLIGNTPSGDSSSSMPSSSSLPTLTFNAVTSLEDIVYGNVAIVGTPDTFSYYALGNAPKQDKYPYYLAGTSVGVSYDESKMYAYSLEGIGQLQIIKNLSGYYSIYNTVNKSYLYNYISGTHYDIGYSVPKGQTASSEWIITKEKDGFAFRGLNDPYLDISNQKTFLGVKEKPGMSLLVYSLGA